MAQLVKPPTGSGHDLTVCDFEPRVRLCADSSDPGACFGFCVSLSLCLSPALSLSFPLSLSKKQINIKRKRNPDAVCADSGAVLMAIPPRLECSLT